MYLADCGSPICLKIEASESFDPYFDAVKDRTQMGTLALSLASAIVSMDFFSPHGSTAQFPLHALNPGLVIGRASA